MASFKYSAGIMSVGSYQISGIPYITGSASMVDQEEIKVEFPAVAKNVLVINETSQDIRIHFNATGSGNVVGGRHFLTLTANRDSVSMATRCKEIYISNPGPSNASFTLMAELTGISSPNMNNLTGSGLTE